MSKIVENQLPKHIAIIMDGNGRWAKDRGLKRTAGHEEGAKTVRAITEHCAKIGIKYLTLYAFSTENWNRPKLEVDFLMRLLERYLKSELDTYLKNNIRFKAIGDIEKFSKNLQETIQYVEDKTSNCSGLTQTLALNYGSQDEISRAVNKALKVGEEITPQIIEKYLDSAYAPNVDLVIRTSGEVRISNFLLWQSAYAEYFFTKTLWPDFDIYELDDIISDFSKRERRFGGV
ncbi:MAG: di-trans,poly-cis-decaprenylcistransferase [Arcobacteraceae bacterium]|jgi:undecaprenyl diphosphate synthase|nr:di-trans,poly-cis-decaprenylcistransferase [Arcobacteraceae bacterium]MDY0364653.1 di-trans,poly-cis-decaprenylcistransferase [Arcobacteraceae bacterium]